MPYSAVTQPRPWPFSQGGRRSSRLAVTRTWVSPNFTKQEPSAYLTTPRSSETARNSSACRWLGRIYKLPHMGAHHTHTPGLNKTTSMVNSWLVSRSYVLVSHDIPIGATQVSLAALNERSREIFRQI